MVFDVIDELQQFYDDNRSELSWYGADDDPDTVIEYSNRVDDLVDKIEEEYGTNEEGYAGKVGPMLASRVREELEVPMGSPGEGHQDPNFDKARSLLGETVVAEDT